MVQRSRKMGGAQHIAKCRYSYREGPIMSRTRETPEYRALRKATGKLTRAVKNNITSICAELAANDLITPDQQKEFRNPHHDAVERAADLVQFLTDRVEQDPSNYHTLVAILDEDRGTYKDVLEYLVLSDDSVDPTLNTASGMARQT